MTIRPATLDDLPALLRMAQAFVAHTSYSGRIAPDSEAILELVTGLLQHGLLLVAVDGYVPVGMLGAGPLYRNPMTGEQTACELAWWIDPDARVRAPWRGMLKAFEQWAVRRGATVLQVSAPSGPLGDRVGKLYGYLGYDPLETTWMRRVA